MTAPVAEKSAIHKSILPWLFFPIAISLSYWLVFYVYLSKYPFYLQIALRTFKDYVFLWLIKSLSQFDFHPTYVFEHDPGSVQASPLLSLLPYVAGYRLFGNLGFVVADVVVVSAVFLMLVAFLRWAGAHRHWAILMAVSALALAYLVPAANVSPGLVFGYSFRFPRPLVSQLFLIGCLCCLVAQMRTDVGSRSYLKLSALYAVSLALLAQTDVYSTFVAVTGYALVLVWRIRCARGIALKQLVLLALTGLITIVLCGPMIYQIADADPSAQLRMGLFTPQSRLSLAAAYASDKNTLFMIVVFGVLALAALWLRRLARRGPVEPALEGGLSFVPILGLSGLLSPAAFLLLSPALAQLYHLKLVQVYVAVMVALLVGACGLTVIAARLGWESQQPDARPNRLVVGGVVAASLLATAIVYGAMAVLATHRQEPGHLPELAYDQAPAPEQFRDDLAAVLKKLEPLQRDANTVLATNEQLVATWWVFERNGKVLLPDTFATTLPTSVLDRRFVYFYQLLDTPRAEFRDIIQRTSMMVYEQLYQATPTHSFSTIADYTPAQQEIIRSTNWEDCWVVYVPISEIDRLAGLLDDRSRSYRVDIVVLQKALDGSSATPRGFTRYFENANFTVWTKRP